MNIIGEINRMQREILEMGVPWLPTPCSEAEIAALSETVRSEFTVALPNEYLDVLRQADGIGYDGTALFGSKPYFKDGSSKSPLIDGVVEFNRGLRDDDASVPDQFCLASDGTLKFCVQAQTGEYASFDLYGRSKDIFDTFAAMFRRMFRIPRRESDVS